MTRKNPKKSPKDVKRHLPEIILILTVFLVFFVVFSIHQEELLQDLRNALSDITDGGLLERFGITPVLALLSGSP